MPTAALVSFVVAATPVGAAAPAAPEEPKRAEPMPAEHSAGCELMFPENVGRDAFIPEIWPGGIVPFTFDENVSALNRSRTHGALAEIMAVSAVRFVPRTTEEDYIVVRDSNRNSSFVGRIGGPQELNMVSWSSRGIIIHEFLHALGNYHEQSRPDRDAYVEIQWDNIVEGRENNFAIRDRAEPEGPYDFLSVMHYGPWAFSSNGFRTITMQPGFAMYADEIGAREGLSEGDILGLTARYGDAVPADFTFDGYVDATDLAILLAAWGAASGDITGDDRCDAADLAALLSSWGATGAASP